MSEEAKVGKRAAAIRELDEALAAMEHRYRVDLPEPPWDVRHMTHARARVAGLLDHLCGWRPVAPDESERAMALRDRAISAACRLWLAVAHPFEPVPVEPVGERESAAFVSTTDGCGGFVPYKWSVYPPSPCGERLREARTGIAKGAPRVSLSFEAGEPVLALDGPPKDDEDRQFLSLGEAARLVGLTAAQVSGLERGALALEPEAWEELVALVDEARLSKGSP